MNRARQVIREDNVEELRRLLDENPGLLEEEGLNWWPQMPLLHFACQEGSTEAACFLLDRGAGISNADRHGATPLKRACVAGRVGVVRLLLARGADPTLCDHQSSTALMWASRHPGYPPSDHVAVIRLLLEDGRVEVDARAVDGTTALWSACCRGHLERARVLLLEGGADHTIGDNEGVTPMAVARGWDRHWTVRLLEWFEGELERAALLSKARAVVDATESISKAPEKVGAKTRGEAQRAREAAAPAWLRGRVDRGEALPSVEVVGVRQRKRREKEEEAEREAVYEYIVRHMKEDLYIELAEGMRLR